MLLRITNTPRPYAWGSRTAIAEMLGRTAGGGPEAELWLGSHPSSPARIITGAGEPDLARWAATHHPEGRLPVLLKVLAAAEPLSLQVHPSAEQAREGFERESAEGVPLDHPARNYRDPFSKPEIIVAVSDGFRALCGFREPEEAHRDLLSLHDTRVEPLLDRLRGPVDLREALGWLLGRGRSVDGVVDALTEHAAAQDVAGPAWLATVRMLAERYPGDPGIAISALLNSVELKAGQALWLPAGNLHAYLQGLGLELMTASDNVLRGGLTAKHVDVAELLRVVDARPLPAPLLEPEHPIPGLLRYAPPGAGFALLDVRVEEVPPGALRLPRHALALCLEGEPNVDGEVLQRGDAALLTDEGSQLSGAGRVAVAITT